MPDAKLIVRDPVTGAVIFDSSTRLFRVLAVVNTGTANGSVSLPDATQGDLVVATGDVEKYHPTFSKSGSTVSWNFGASATGDRQAADAVIGVY